MRPIHHLVSVSGGKDSTATLLLARMQFPYNFSAVFADTGNEHETCRDARPWRLTSPWPSHTVTLAR